MELKTTTIKTKDGKTITNNIEQGRIDITHPEKPTITIPYAILNIENETVTIKQGAQILTTTTQDPKIKNIIPELTKENKPKTKTTPKTKETKETNKKDKPTKTNKKDNTTKKDKKSDKK